MASSAVEVNYNTSNCHGGFSVDVKSYRDSCVADGQNNILYQCIAGGFGGGDDRLSAVAFYAGNCSNLVGVRFAYFVLFVHL